MRVVTCWAFIRVHYPFHYTWPRIMSECGCAAYSAVVRSHRHVPFGRGGSGSHRHVPFGRGGSGLPGAEDVSRWHDRPIWPPGLAPLLGCEPLGQAVLWVIFILQGRRAGSTHSRRRLTLVSHGVRHNIRRDSDSKYQCLLRRFCCFRRRYHVQH